MRPHAGSGRGRARAELAGRLANRTRPRFPLQAGTAPAAVSFLLLAAAHARMRELYVAGAVLGAGYGLAFAAVAVLALGLATAIPRHTR